MCISFYKNGKYTNRLYYNSVLYHLLNDNYTLNIIGHNIKSCLPDRSKVPDHGKTVFFLTIRFGQKTERFLSKMNEIKSKLPLFWYKCDEEMYRSMISQHIRPISAAETSVLGETL